MKRKYQRIWLSVLAVMVVLAMTAGCGSNEGANGKGRAVFHHQPRRLPIRAIKEQKGTSP